jgi:hypothetical protein
VISSSARRLSPAIADAPRPLDRWKLATCLLTVVATVLAFDAWHRRGPALPAARASSQRPARAGSHAATLRQLRIPAHMVGIDEQALIDELGRTRSTLRIAILCERLGFVGTDRALDVLEALSHDRRSGVPEAAIAALGHIGSDNATSLLLTMSSDGVLRVRGAAIAALGRTGQARARDALMAIAKRSHDPMRGTAIAAVTTWSTSSAPCRSATSRS